MIRAERLSAMGNLVQGLAHEIRNPIMTIGGFAKRIKTLCEDKKILRYMEIILDESSRLEEILTKIRLLLDVQEPNFEKDNISPIIDELLERYIPLMDQKGIRFQKQIYSPLPPVIMDSSQISTAISCLLDNAIEATGRGGIISLGISHENGILKIEIMDTGKGISNDEKDSVFDPFFTSKTRGVGLGLTIVHQIVKNHGGEINIKSALGEGTRFIITLPVSGDTKR